MYDFIGYNIMDKPLFDIGDIVILQVNCDFSNTFKPTKVIDVKICDGINCTNKGSTLIKTERDSNWCSAMFYKLYKEDF